MIYIASPMAQHQCCYTYLGGISACHSLAAHIFILQKVILTLWALSALT